ncbi:mucin-5AC-like [Saccostrea cucullata]|uniref:mucin-5AC-like n=1 Tax=Saccostrea cuccullata TaxID=36930 RepID=UPI002ED193ED
MSSDSGILLIRNDGTIQLKGDSKILGEYHLKHRLMARLKPDGSMGVFMIPEQGPNSGKMFAVLPNGPSGKEGVGWEHVVSGDSTYLRPVFRPMTDKRTTPASKTLPPKSTKPPLPSSEPVVIDLCDDTDPVESQKNDNPKQTPQSTAAAPTPVMLFTKDSAAKLNSKSMVVTTSSKTTPDSQTLNTQTKSSTSNSVTVVLSNPAIAQSLKESTISKSIQNTTPVVHSVSRNTQSIGSGVQNLKQNETVARAVFQSSIPSVTSTRIMSNTCSSQTLVSSNVLPSKILNVSQNYIPTVTPSSQQNLSVSARPTVQVPFQSIAGTGQLTKTLASRIVNPNLSNDPQVPRAQVVPTGQHQGLSTSLSTLNRGGLLSSSATQSIRTPQLPTAAFPPLLSPSVTQSRVSNAMGRFSTTVANKIIISADAQSVTTAHTEINETPIQINSVFSLAPVDPIKPWLTNGKNMPLSEVDFWAEAINLKISDDILADKRLRKGCSVVLQRTTSHRPTKMRGCRVKDSQCNVACRKLFVKKLLKDLTRKKHLKLKRRSIYAALRLQIRKKVKEIPSQKKAPQSTPALNNFSHRSLSKPLQHPTPRLANNSVLSANPMGPKTTLANQNRYLLLRMNGQNVLVPNPCTSVNFSSFVSVPICVTANSGTPAIQVNPLNNPRSLLGTRLSLSTGNALTSLGPNLPNPASISSLPSLSQLNQISNALPRVSVNNVGGTLSVNTSVQSGGSTLNSSLPVFNPQSGTMRMSAPSAVSATYTVGSSHVRLGIVNHSTPFPVAVRAANQNNKTAPFPVALTYRTRYRNNPPAPSRPLLQSQMTDFTARIGTSTASNTAVRTLPPTSSSTTILSSQATLLTTTSTVTTATSDAQTAVDEPISSVAKSKVNKGTKYYFIPGGVKIKTEPKSSGYGDEEKKHKKHKKHKRPRSPDSEGSVEKADKKQRVETEGNLADEDVLNDIAKVSSETDIENLSKSEMSAERIKQLREKLSENQRKLEEYLRQVDH